MTRSRTALAVLALVIGFLIGAACARTAYWMDACVARESGGYGASPDWLNRCRD
ncbi:MAG TPA: hypothetical protein VFG15_16930 [Amycolatopsis sp.]|nr:hypothetical protein [Amycolatopsis sp.]